MKFWVGGQLHTDYFQLDFLAFDGGVRSIYTKPAPAGNRIGGERIQSLRLFASLIPDIHSIQYSVYKKAQKVTTLRRELLSCSLLYKCWNRI